MKLPSLFPVLCFAGGILLSGTSGNRWHLPPESAFFVTAFLLLAAYVLLRRQWIVTAAILGAAAWLCLGFAAANLERVSVSSNLAGTLIETGKLDGSAALRWRGRLRGDPLELPWGTRYEIALEDVESSSGVTPVTGGLRLTSYRDESKNDASSRRRAPETASNASPASCPFAISAIPAASIIADTLRARTFSCKARCAAASF